ncbi:hypothetical protein RSAG8_11335, partial [Rhizoctonia solani AG-8 WAC10335]
MASQTQGKVAIVTGASSGIGKATSITLSKAGYRVVLVARREAELKATAEECSSETLVTPGDVTDELFAAKVFEEAVKRFGRVDVLFNNAGISLPAVPIEDIPVKDFRRVIDVNLTSAFIFTREAFKVFKNQTPQGGRIINNGSIAAYATAAPLKVGNGLESSGLYALSLLHAPFLFAKMQSEVTPINPFGKEAKKVKSGA